MLTALGLWARVGDRAQPIEEIKISDGRAGEGASSLFLHFDAAEIEEGPMGHFLEDRFLRAALLDALDAHPRITHRAAARVVDQATEGPLARVTLADGETLCAPLLVGCDGRDSGTAARAGIGRTGWDYGQTALVCAIAHEKPHRGVAHQFFMPAGPLAILPLRGNRSSIVWSERSDTAAALAAIDDEGFLQALRPRFGDFLGGIRLEGARFGYPLGLSLANALVAPRVALVGDAAHGIHPIAGQGLNLGFRDIAALAEVLTLARRRGEDIGAPDVLERYQRWRRFDTAALAVATDAFNRLFSSDNPLLRGVRDLGLGLVNALPGARRAFIREAAGLTGEVPSLLRGRPV
jgi:2-octaprenyl-6-methoxyphenol hydroxylase